jgi:hypothetical protein
VSETFSGGVAQVFSAAAKPFAVTRTIPEVLLATENENLPSALVMVV